MMSIVFIILGLIVAVPIVIVLAIVILLLLIDALAVLGIAFVAWLIDLFS